MHIDIDGHVQGCERMAVIFLSDRTTGPDIFWSHLTRDTPATRELFSRSSPWTSPVSGFDAALDDDNIEVGMCATWKKHLGCIDKHREKMSDPFLSSMTFATQDFRAESIACDCDDCGINVHIPARILETLRARKRQKRYEGNVSE